MKESREVEVKSTEPKELTTSTSMNISERPLQSQPQAELVDIKPKIQISKFESLLVNSFKKLVGFNEPKQEKSKELIAQNEINKINACEEIKLMHVKKN